MTTPPRNDNDDLGLVHFNLALLDHPVRQEHLPHDLIAGFLEETIRFRNGVRVEEGGWDTERFAATCELNNPVFLTWCGMAVQLT